MLFRILLVIEAEIAEEEKEEDDGDEQYDALGDGTIDVRFFHIRKKNFFLK